ncbi:MAG TPA: PCP reductase family protein [Candidatus Tectomicrobia bacterium]
MQEQERMVERLQAVEDKLVRLETLLVTLSQKLATPPVPQAEVTTVIRDWVTDYVSMRLQQLVPHTCDHIPPAADAQGPYLDGTNVPCTDEVVHRIGRIPIPFVREMVVQRVAERARQEHVVRVDVAFFERAATF